MRRRTKRRLARTALRALAVAMVVAHARRATGIGPCANCGAQPGPRVVADQATAEALQVWWAVLDSSTAAPRLRP